MNSHQRKALHKFRSQASTQWALAADFIGISRRTWDTLVQAGYLEERRDGPQQPRRELRLTELGKRETA